MSEGMERYYRDLYEKERKKNEALTEQLVEAENRAADLAYKVDLVKNSLLFRMVKPFRTAWAKFKNLCIRIRRYKNPKDLMRKIKSKMIERSAYKYHGTESFPSPEEAERQRNQTFRHKVKFSVLVPLYNTPENFLREMIDSVLAQTYENWELCLADGSDDAHSYVADVVRQYIEKDGAKRIQYKKIEKNLGISENTNVCFTLATGDYIGLFDHDDLLHPCALYEYAKVIDETGADFIYCDEATFQGDSVNNMITLHFKPEFAIDNLRANNYICHFSVFKESLLEEAGLFRKEFDGSQDHDMILRLTASAQNIRHVPKILYYWRSHELSVAADINAKTYAIDAAKGAVAAHLSQCGFQNFKIESTKAFATIFRIRYELLGNPKISIVIPNKDHADDLRRCVESIQTRASYENYEIVIVENNSTTGEIKEYYEILRNCPNIKIVEYQGGFNYAKICNFGVKHSDGEFILLLNNDTEVITRNFIEELLMYAQRSDVGAVGCKLYYGDHTIQHAGIVLGLGAHRTAGHTHYRLAKENLGYMGRLCYAQNVSAVTGACLMVKKSDYEAVEGLSEEFAVALNDVDFCLKLRKRGLLNIFTPFAELFHYESKSRGADVKEKNAENAKRYEEESDKFRKKWKTDLENGDPYYNPNFSLDHSNYTLRGNATSMVE